MLRHYVPLLVFRSISVGRRITLALDVSVDVHVQMVVLPAVVPCSHHVCHVLHALVHWSSLHDILLRLGVVTLRLSFGVAECVAAGNCESVRQQQLEVCRNTLDACLVDVVALTDSGPTLVLQCGEF